MNERLHALVVDDEKNIRTTLSVCLQNLGCDVAEASSADAARAAVRRQGDDVVFLDLKLGTSSGMDLLPELLAESPSAAVVMVTRIRTGETGDDALRHPPYPVEAVSPRR